jgi:hypothetical protein
MTSLAMLVATLVAIGALIKRKWLAALLGAAVLAGLLTLTPDGHTTVHSLTVFAAAVA